MPIITIEFSKIEKETKAQLAATLTKNASEILKIPENTITTMIKENDPNNVAIGGKLLTDLHK